MKSQRARKAERPEIELGEFFCPIIRTIQVDPRQTGHAAIVDDVEFGQR